MNVKDSLGQQRVDRLLVGRLNNNNSTVPKRGTARYDLSSTKEVLVPSKGKAMVRTGLVVSIPIGIYARIAPRFGLAVKRFVDVGVRVVDTRYHNVLGAVMFNHADDDFHIRQGDRIA